ncbi:hypothetical protein D7147_01115 [Micromonospora musae]|uniref:PPE domain-containing protein n=1 Tax=Micromonospora musae TaxID=1894970 RepID=A0ABX9RIH4_9ACTN|nr:hypothetical protein D7147_01115 [Micromonospora musae]
MIERGSGRTSSLTDWHRMDVNSMWACLQDHDTANHWKQVAGWRKICDLAQAHLSRLQEYRRGLAAAWPPASNTAALAYLSQLDELIDKVRRTHDAAATNYTALAAATQAIGGTRTRLQKIHEEYAAKLQQKRAYEATAADPKAAMGSRVTDRPVTDADLEQLNVQARGIMYGLSTELQQAQAALRQPPVPTRPPRQSDNPDVYGSIPTPAIPPIVPVPVRPPALTKPVPPSRGTVRPTATPPSLSGPVLGAADRSTIPPAKIGTPTTPPPVDPNSLPSLPSGTPSRPSIRNGLGLPPNASGKLSMSDRNLPPATSSSTQPRATPFGGLIGNPPGSGVGNRTSNDSQAGRANPIGGVIGGGGAGTAPAGGAGSRPGGGRGFGTPSFGAATNPAPGTFSSRGEVSHRTTPWGSDADKARRWDPTNPWQVDRGVDPVVLPPGEDGPTDPGPAIGLDR